MPNESTVLENYFIFTSNLSHDRAREVIEKEKEQCRGGTNTSWSQLLTMLLNLSTAEKTYHSLTFLTPRTGSVFLRKEQSLKSVYQSLMVDTRNSMEVSDTSDQMSQVCQDLSRVFQMRTGMIDIYEKLCNLTPTSFLTDPFKEILPTLAQILKDLKKDHSDVIKSWLVVLEYECGILLDFLTSCVTMMDNNYFDSIMLLQRGGENMTRWDTVVQARETRKLGFASSWLRVSGTVELQLYTWFQRLKSALMSKFSLYFYSTLSQQTTPADMKSLCSKLSVDQTARLSSYQKRLDAVSVSVLYDASGQSNYQGPGYHFHDKDNVSLAGLDLFPLVYTTGFQSGQHWPNVVMIISDQSSDLSNDKTVPFFDVGVGATYFLHQIEPRFYIVIIFEGRRNEKDSAINGFIQETVFQLRCCRIFASLKPGYK